MSDRSKVKDFLKGLFVTIAGIADANDIVERINEETFTFITFAAAPYVEQGVVMKKACRVKSITLTAATTLAAHADNNITATVAKRDGEGGNAAVIGASTTDVAGGALTAFTPKSVAIDTDNATFAASEVLTFKTADNGTTTEPLLSCAVTVEYI